MKSEKQVLPVPQKGPLSAPIKLQTQQPPSRVPVAAPQPHAAVARQRPTNYAEAASGKSLHAEVASEASSLLASMGVSNSYDDLLEFLYTNSSEEWRIANMPRGASTYNLKQLQKLAEALLQSFTVQEPVATSGKKQSSRVNFDGALAGARILEWVQGGNIRQDVAENHSASAATPEQQCLNQAKREQPLQREQRKQPQQLQQCQQPQCQAEEQWDCTWQSQYYDQMAGDKQWSQDECGNWYVKDGFAACKLGAPECSHLVSEAKVNSDVLRSEFVPEVIPQTAPMGMALPPGCQIVMMPVLPQGMHMYDGSLGDIQMPMQAMHAVPAGMQLVAVPLQQAQAMAFEQAQAMMGQQQCPQEMQLQPQEQLEEQCAHHYDTDDEA